ncbi:SPOR domain-containing protein [Sphingorhabdus sp. Alg239-R122]|uniref:SPOR domain-containing protein n=1 Tax=Sphingorhabdus sp. Alg239-R122 TaxID=2305989 RepID=UPI0013DC4286|nr:SPOR domain-containing protein [Sphingorhabdus sp. Alg239-R122]
MAGDNMTGENDSLGFDEDDSLPWLESAEDYDEVEGGNIGRILGFVLMGLIALAAIAGGAYWYQNSSAGAGSDGGGALITAEKDDYKIPPEDPQGKEFEGTGDASFSASEGVPKQAAIGDSETAAKKAAEKPRETKAKPAPKKAAPAAPKAVKQAPKPETKEAPKPAFSALEEKSAADTPKATTPKGVIVQLGAYSSEAKAKTGWTGLARKYDYIASLPKTIVAANVDGGTVYRLSAIAPNNATANNVCNRLKASGGACYIRR